MSETWIGRFWRRQRGHFTLARLKEIALGFLFLILFGVLVGLAVLAGKISLYVVFVGFVTYAFGKLKRYVALKLVAGTLGKLWLFIFYFSRAVEKSGKAIFLVLLPFVAIQIVANNQSSFDVLPFLNVIEDVSLWISEVSATMNAYAIQNWLAALALIVIPLLEALGVITGVSGAAADLFKHMNTAILISCFSFFGIQSANFTSEKWHFDVRQSAAILSARIESSLKQAITANAVAHDKRFLESTFSQYVSSLITATSAHRISKEALHAYISGEMTAARAMTVPLDDLLIARAENASAKQIEDVLRRPLQPAMVRAQLAELQTIETAVAKQARSAKSALSSAISLTVTNNIPGLEQRVLQTYVDEVIDTMAQTVLRFSPRVKVNAVAAIMMAAGVENSNIHYAPVASRLPVSSYQRVLSPMNADDIAMLKAAQHRIDAIALRAAKAKSGAGWRKLIRFVVLRH